MTIRLADLRGCFEGVIPSIISTASADGMPNISYLSHVAMIDDDRVALSNQFFAKTSANVRANPQVTLLLVDGVNGRQYSLDIRFERSVDEGALFDHIALQLKASSAQVGMAGIMRLRSADIFEVLSIAAVPSAVEAGDDAETRKPASLADVRQVAKAIESETEAAGIIDALLGGLYRDLRCESALLLLNDPDCGVLTTVGSIGYETAGLGSEVRGDEGLIASAARYGKPIKVSDRSRVSRLGGAILGRSAEDENAARMIAFPQLANAMSQLAVPVTRQNRVRGVIFVESTRRMAFGEKDVAAIEILGQLAANALALSETDAGEVPPLPARPTDASIPGRTIQIVHHTFDDSVFIGNDYVIKGVAGRLLAYLVTSHLRDGRTQFSNREIRLAEALRLPDLKDNLETRLLLLRRRLEAKQFPIRLQQSGRGRFTLEIDGMPLIRTMD